MFQGLTAGTSTSDRPREDDRPARRVGPLNTPVSSDGRSLLDRDDLLQKLDRAAAKRVTVISAPAGSGKTSLLRAWAERAAAVRRVAFVSVRRDQQDAQRFWSNVYGAIRRPAA